MSPYAQDHPNGSTLAVRMHPGARKNAITGIYAEALKISLTSPPIDGRANDALIAFLSEALHLPRARITLLTGGTNRFKTLHIAGKSAAEVQAALDPTKDC
jgi:hypothetical protein